MDEILKAQIHLQNKPLVIAISLLLSHLHAVLSLEEPRPEVFLQPRNFNPHPYQHGARGRLVGRNGPVLFPTNPGDDPPDNKSGFVAITENSATTDSHPYPKVARKHKYRVPGRFDDEQNEVDSDVYDALAEHGAKVLAHPPQDLKHLKSKGRGKDYAFAYKVLDHLTGDDFSHVEERNSRATSGEYRVKLPDGRTQIVSYRADKNGYNADVKYEPDMGESRPEVVPQKLFRPQNVIPIYHRQGMEVQRVPVRQLTPVHLRKYYDYDYEDREQQLVSPLVVLPTPIPAHYVDVPITARPTHLQPVPGNQHLLQSGSNVPQRHPNVQIITTNARDYSTGSYIPSTVSPNYKTIQHYQRQPSAPVPTVHPQPQPLIINNGNHGLFSPQPAPTAAFVITDRNGNVINNVKIIPTTVTPLILVNGEVGHRKHNVVSTTPQPFIINVASSASANEEEEYKRKK